jgi:hypothetical protein
MADISGLIAEQVLERALAKYELRRPSDIAEWLVNPKAIFIDNLEDEVQARAAANALRSPSGLFTFHVNLGDPQTTNLHPLVVKIRDAEPTLRLGTEISHPLESDSRDLERKFDGVVTLRNLRASGIALSAAHLPLHQDGLGWAGSVRFVAMCLDRKAADGGEQQYANVLGHAIALAARSWRDFVSATALDAVTVTRTCGSQRIAVTGPLIYVDSTGLVATNFRMPGGEYTVRANEASGWLARLMRAISDDATHVKQRLTEPGTAVLLDNLSIAHSRTGFTEYYRGQRRLARKWYAISPDRVAASGCSQMFLTPDIYGS